MIMYDYQMRRDPLRDTVRHYCMWIYVFAPLVGAVIAAKASGYH